MDLGDADQAALQYREAIRLNPNEAGRTTIWPIS